MVALVPREAVLLVHGLLRTPRCWSSVRRLLEREGFACSAFAYPSLRGRFEVHGRRLARALEGLDADPAVARIHLVGHSLGNLVIRAALHGRRPAKLGRVVMLVPPNQGSAVARLLAPLLGRLVPVLRQLSDRDGSDARSMPALSGPECGVIAARFDHLVAERSTHLTGEADHLLVPASHSLLMNRPDVQRAIVQFLRVGRFPRGR